MAKDAYYPDELDFGDEHFTGSAGADFWSEQLQSTPWWVISASLHLFVICVILPLIRCDGPLKVPPIKMQATLDTIDEPPLEEQPEPQESSVQNPKLPVVTEPVDSDRQPSDHTETANEEDSEQAKGQEQATSDVQMDSKFNNDAIGPGASAGGTYGGRLGGRIDATRSGGGDLATENAVLLGLIWLDKHQDKSGASAGKWDGDGFMRHDPASDPCSGAALLGWVDPGLTGLATLAFLGAGHTQKYGRFKETVQLALKYMTDVQSADGLIGGKRGHYLYNHAICSLALAEAYGMTKSPLIKAPATKAIQYLVQARNEGMAWRYGEQDGDNDVSVTGWCVMALKSAKAAGLDVPGMDQAFKDAESFIEALTDSDYYVTGYKSRPPKGYQGPTSSRFINEEIGINTADTHDANHTPTAIATMCRVFFGYKQNDPRLRGGANVLAQMLPVYEMGGGGKRSQVDFYYWYYGTLAMFQMGGDHWRQWNKHMKKALVDHQQLKGSVRGSWDPEPEAWGKLAGRVYATAVNVLSLEIYYRYARVFR
jgi:hypothetical protein